MTSKKRLRGRLGNLPMPLRKKIIQSWQVPSAEYGRTRRDLGRAEPILAACTPWNTSLFIPDYGCMPIERLSIRRMRVLGAFPAVLDDPNFKFSQGNMPPDPPSMFMHYRSVHSTEGLQTRLQTNCQSIHSDITSPY